MNIVIISSAINSHQSTIFSKQERFHQTILTIESVRKHINNAHIILFDMTDISEYKNELNKYVNKYLDLSQEINAVNYSRRDKSLGEAYCTLIALNYITNERLSFQRIFKISGRYALNDNFDIIKFKEDKYTFKRTYEHQFVYHTTFYSIHNIETFLNHMKNVLYRLINCMSINIESALYDVLNDYTDVNEIDQIGITGYVGPNGKIYNV